MKTTSASDLLMDEATAAAALLLSVRTLQRWRVEGRGPKFVKLGKRVFYTRAALERVVADSERQSTSQSLPTAAA
jgi:hypothetical protein